MADLSIDVPALEHLSASIRPHAAEVGFGSTLSHPNADAFGSTDVIAAVRDAASIQAAEAKGLADAVTALADAATATASQFTAADKALTPARATPR